MMHTKTEILLRIGRHIASLIPVPLRRAFRPRKAHIPLFQRVVVELQSHCNRDCYFCCRESDALGKRKLADGTSVREFMPTDKVMTILDELESLGFTGHITFHHLSEAFLDKRLVEVAEDARRRGMRPYVHTNGDVLRDNELLCKAAANVFEYMVVGLYDYATEDEKAAEKEFWQQRLRGTQVMFSLAENVYVRTHSANNDQMRTIVRQTHPKAVCAEPQKYFLIHYNGDVCCCCEDMYGDLLRSNVFESSIREIWRSDRHADLVNDLRFGERHKYDLCAKCTMGPNHYSRDPMQATWHYDK
jgi:MoaA/NifB/PqqE/SkfB family radical SAM enzyme